MYDRIKIFFEGVRAEFRKVTWPTKPVFIKQTGVVIVLAAIMSAFLGSVDYSLSEVIQIVVQ